MVTDDKYADNNEKIPSKPPSYTSESDEKKEFDYENTVFDDEENTSL